MNKIIISFVIVAGLLAGCKDDNHKHGDAEHGHLHGDDVHAGVEPEPLAYTLYTDKLELFVEFKPLIVGETSKFAAHFTRLGKNFKAITEGSVTVGLIGNEAQLTDKAEKPSSPGIFQLALTPENPGTYQLVFVIQTNLNFKLKIMKMKKNNIILEKTFDFALSIIELYKKMTEQKEYVLLNDIETIINIITAIVKTTQKKF